MLLTLTPAVARHVEKSPRKRGSGIGLRSRSRRAAAREGQTAMSIHVAQGEREAVAGCRSFAQVELRGISGAVAGVGRLRATFQIDADGLPAVTGREQFTRPRRTSRSTRRMASATRRSPRC